MKRLFYILSLLLLPLLAVAQEAKENMPLKYLGDYVRGDKLFILDGHIVHPDSVPLIFEEEDIEKIEVHGRGMHLFPELKYMLNGEAISKDEAGNIVVADILWMKFIDGLTLSIITNPNMIMYVVDGKVANPDCLPEKEEIIHVEYDTFPLFP